MIKYITAAEADHMRRGARGLFDPRVPLSRVDWRRQPGVVGVASTDYYIVPDDDLRLTNEQRLHALARRLPAPDPTAGA